MPTGVPATFPYAQIQSLEVTGSCSLPANQITDANITGSGSNSVKSTKLEHQYQPTYSQPYASYNVADRKVIHNVYGAAGVILSLKAKLPQACTGGSTATVNWYLSGTLIGTTTFHDTDPANTVKTVSPSSAVTAAGDDIQVEITVTGGTPGKGIAASAILTEYAG